ncbi:hypothetical protein N9L68_02220 [bacterium]|nr:hypothetical protein [bacterium]
MEEDQFQYYVPCPLAHPGLCATKHREYFDDIKQCCKSMQRMLATRRVGTFLCLRVVGDGGHQEAFVCFSHLRGGGPKLAILSTSSLCEDTGFLSIDRGGSMCNQMVDASLIGTLLVAAGGPGSVKAVYCSAPTRDPELPSSPSSMYVASSWRAAQEELEVCLFPAVPQAAARTDKRLKEMRDGLKKVQGDDEPPRKKPAKKTWGVKLVMPRAASVVEHPGGSASDVASQDEGNLLHSTSSGSDVVPMCGYPDPAPAVPDDGPPPSAGSTR